MISSRQLIHNFILTHNYCKEVISCSTVECCCACYHRHSVVWSRPWSDTARPTAMAWRSRPGSLQACSDSSTVSERPRTTVSFGALHFGLQCWHAAASAFRHLLAVPRFRLNVTAVGLSQLLARWPGTNSRIISGIQRAALTILGVYLKRTCSRVTSASSVLEVLNDNALYKSTRSVTRSLFPEFL